MLMVVFFVDFILTREISSAMHSLWMPASHLCGTYGVKTESMCFATKLFFVQFYRLDARLFIKKRVKENYTFSESQNTLHILYDME